MRDPHTNIHQQYTHKKQNTKRRRHTSLFPLHTLNLLHNYPATDRGTVVVVKERVVRTKNSTGGFFQGLSRVERDSRQAHRRTTKSRLPCLSSSLRSARLSLTYLHQTSEYPGKHMTKKINTKRYYLYFGIQCESFAEGIDVNPHLLNKVS